MRRPIMTAFCVLWLLF